MVVSAMLGVFYHLFKLLAEMALYRSDNSYVSDAVESRTSAVVSFSVKVASRASGAARSFIRVYAGLCVYRVDDGTPKHQLSSLHVHVPWSCQGGSGTPLVNILKSIERASF